jgi:pyruvate/2-oxoglutarate dehydrogenase complex dihydrolipoamide acyltransferase (E2) component
MQLEIRLPSLGEDEDAVTGGTIAFWLADVGAVLREGDDLLELTTDKAAFVAPCPANGILTEQCVAAGAEVAVGDLLGMLDTQA